MSNMQDFIRWRGDLPFSAVPVGEVDGLILAQLAMYRWEMALPEGGEAMIGDLAPQMTEKPVSEGYTTENDAKMLALVGPSERFGRVLLGDYVHERNEEMQFAAATLRLPGGAVFVAFRGTDSAIVGWREDCNMAFSKPVPAQEAARNYLARVAALYPGELMVGGHSKGGNLAMYAASTVDEGVLARISAVYNYDGPGLSDHMDAPAHYARLGERLHSFLPQGSVVGLLLAHPDEFTVVKSNSISILQHDPYSWQVEGPRFVRMAGLSRDSARFDAAFRAWLGGVDESERAELVDTLFGILGATNARRFDRDFWVALAQNTKAVREAIGGVEPDTRRRVIKMLADLSSLSKRPAPKKPKGDEKTEKTNA